MAKTTLRNFRISDEVYDPALEKAKREGISLTDIVRDALIEYVEGYEDED